MAITLLYNNGHCSDPISPKSKKFTRGLNKIINKRHIFTSKQEMYKIKKNFSLTLKKLDRKIFQSYN